MKKIQPIILAAGKGKRMNTELPKALMPLAGEPFLVHILRAVAGSKLVSSSKPLIVIGNGGREVREAMGPDYLYATQHEQLGTGHAVKIVEPVLQEIEQKAEHVMVLYGDHPLITSQMVEELGRAHLESGAKVTMGTVKVSDFEEWRAGFFDYGRIVRDGEGNLQAIVEKKDAAPHELLITEVNPSYFCFEANWLWDRLALLQNNNAQKEYYLTDLVKIAAAEKSPIGTVEIDPVTALGANTPEQLAVLEQFL